MQSLASTNTGRADFVTRWTVEQIKEQNGHCRGYKYYVWVIKTSAFKLTLRMQAAIPMLVSTCILMDIMDLIPSIKFLAHNTGRRLSQLEGRFAGNGRSLRSKFENPATIYCL